MPTRKSTPTFIVTLPLATTPAVEKALDVRLNAARHIYNACLTEGLRRLDLMRQSRAWKAAQAMPKGKPRSAQRKARSKAFNSLWAQFELSQASLESYARTCRDACWISDHLGGHDTQTTALRAFRAIEQYVYGSRGRPRFARFGEFTSIEGKEHSLITVKDGVFRYGKRITAKVITDHKNAWQVEAIKARTKYCRLVRKEIRGRQRYYVQMAKEGVTPEKRKVKRGVVGLDIGPSTIAMVSAESAAFETFCPTVDQPWKDLRRIERAMDRSRRATNPDAFNADGTYKRGGKIKNRSERYRKLAVKRRERERRLAAERRRQHGELANRVLGQGTVIKTEKLSYRSFQKNFGRSTKVRGAAMFVGVLRQKAKDVGGEVVEFSTYRTRLSQFDHTTGELRKKSLNERMHVFGDGATAPVQRDIYSAFLARFVHQDCLDASHAEHAWPTAEPLLRAASNGKKPASGRGFALPHVTDVRAGRSEKIVNTASEAGDAVARRARAPESGQQARSNCNAETIRSPRLQAWGGSQERVSSF